MTNPLISALEQGLATAPENVQIMLALAEAYQSNQQRQQALELFQKVIALEPANANVLSKAITLAQALDKSELVAGYQALLSATGEVNTTRMSGESEVINSVKRVRGQPLKLVAGNTEQEQTEEIEAEDTHIYLDDVGGMHEVKRRLKLSFLAPLQNADLVKQYGKSLGGGLILYGPPGCGKTFIARALAGELGAKFISVGLSDVLDMYIGESERKLHEIFESARRATPAVLFFDELDALGQKRSQLKTSGLRTLVNQLLNEMDSVNNNNDGLFILAATNHPWDIDGALKRPGRFDRMVAVFPPDLDARKTILQTNLAKTPTDNVDIDHLANQTEMFSGADLKHLCQSAIEGVFERSLETQSVEPITSADFTFPLKENRPSTRSWFESARNFAMFANQDGQYDDLMNYIRDNKL